jgi:uncharacterized membrane protein
MSQPQPAGIGKARIEALADGIFAIAMTLLVLDLKTPAPGPGDTADDLPRKLVEMWPRFLTYVVSFLILGVLWVGHHAQLHYVRRSDRPFLWMNLAFLMVVSAMPFSTALLGAYREQPVAVAVYCGNLVVAGLVLFGQLHYAAGPGKLFDADMDPDLIRAGSRRLLMGPALYSLAAGLAFISTTASLAVCALTPLLYLLPGRVDRLWSSEGRPPEGDSPTKG